MTLHQAEVKLRTAAYAFVNVGPVEDQHDRELMLADWRKRWEAPANGC